MLRYDLGSPERSSQGEENAAHSHWAGCELHISKVLNSTEDAHTKSMSTFETDEHLQALVPSQALCIEGDRSLAGEALRQPKAH
jgi:hypothetical protein